MRIGPFEVVMVLLLLSGVAWIIYQLTRKPPVTNWEVQKRELQDLRGRLTELQTSISIPTTDATEQPSEGKL